MLLSDCLCTFQVDVGYRYNFSALIDPQILKIDSANISDANDADTNRLHGVKLTKFCPCDTTANWRSARNLLNGFIEQVDEQIDIFPSDR